MGTIHRFDGFRVVVYPNDHQPAHVHVIGGDVEALFNLNCPKGPPELRENFGCSGKVLSRIETELREQIEKWCAGWSEIHGDP